MKTYVDEYLVTRSGDIVGSVTIGDDSIPLDDFIKKLKEADSHLKEKGFLGIDISFREKYEDCFEVRVTGKKPAPPVEKKKKDELLRNSCGYARYLEMKKEYSHLDRDKKCAYLKGGSCNNSKSYRHTDWNPKCDHCNDYLEGEGE